MSASHRPRAEVELEVRYAETDQMGVVHHSVYLVWFEVARTSLCSQAGHPYATIEAAGYFLVVSGAEVTYREAARYGERVTVTCWLERIASRALAFGYEARAGERLLATGLTRHVWVDRSTGRHCRMPETLAPSFRRLAEPDPRRSEGSQRGTHPTVQREAPASGPSRRHRATKE